MAGLTILFLLAQFGGCSQSRYALQPRRQPAEERGVWPGADAQLVFPERASSAYTMVLPGVSGTSTVDAGIVKGLAEADIPSAIELYDWTAHPNWRVYNLRAIEWNRNEAQRIAAKIAAYQDRFPGRPVHLIGYSGGAGIAVFALEALAPGRKVMDAVLIAPTLATDYDLSQALARTERGICNFYSPLDAGVLMLATAAVGTSEGRHTVAAGAVGFQASRSGSRQGADTDHGILVQQPYSLEMLACGHAGGHWGWTSPAFVRKWVAPLVQTPDAPQLAASPQGPPSVDPAEPSLLPGEPRVLPTEPRVLPAGGTEQPPARLAGL